VKSTYLEYSVNQKISKMSLINEKDLQKLSNQENKTCISIFIPTERAGKDVLEEKNKTHLKSLWKEVGNELKKKDISEEKIQEMIKREKILVDVDGAVTGQINGLSVYQTGQYTFGRPSRITAETYLGQEGVMNIEREVDMSGKIHNKGVMILTGYVGGKYAQEKPLSLSASLAFEQSYGGIDGDSASCAELIALLSSISEIPIKQSYAITGSMNQKGIVQPIGGVNQKIEGFYKICQLKGLTGEQGVVIPVQNQENLMLKEEVINAVENDEFNIYIVKNIDEAIELMMDKPAAIVHEKVEKALSQFAKKTSEFGKTKQK
jgi:predicted ATP-dependent protease